MLIKTLNKTIKKMFKIADKHTIAVFAALIFLSGMYVCLNYNKDNMYEAFTTNSCPNVLLQEGNFIYLFNSNRAKVPGVNPLRFNNLDEYSEFLDWQRSQGIRCPVLYLQQLEDAQGQTSFKVRPSIFDKQGGLPPSIVNDKEDSKEEETKLFDATRDNPKFNQNDYASVDTHNQYIGLNTPLDKMFHEKEKDLKSDNPMDDNWGGAKYSREQVESGKYKEDEVYM